MDRREACHQLADINERIYEIENSLSKIEIKLYTCKESEKDWYLEKRDELLEELERKKQEAKDFISEYGDIIYS